MYQLAVHAMQAPTGSGTDLYCRTRTVPEYLRHLVLEQLVIGYR